MMLGDLLVGWFEGKEESVPRTKEMKESKKADQGKRNEKLGTKN